MKFLADESCDFIVVHALRQQGYDVMAICEMAPSMEDADIMRLAGKGKRILITEDKDFGQIFYATTNKKHTVILVRYPNNIRKSLALDFVKFVKSHGRKIAGSFVVMQPGRVRITR